MNDPLMQISLAQPLHPEPLQRSNMALPHGRFEFATEEHLAKLAEGIKSTKWALGNGAVKEMKSTKPRHIVNSISSSPLTPCRYREEPVPDDLFTANDPQMLCKHLSRFVGNRMETPIHPQHCMAYYALHDVNCVNFMDKKDRRFDSFRLHSEGIGRQIKKAKVLTREDERMLWDSGVMNLDVPRGLLNAVFFTTGKMFCLRGGQEHRFLYRDQKENMCIMKIYRKTEMEVLNYYT